MCLIAFSFYLYFADWGNLDPGFFIGSGTILLLFGLSVALTSCVGCQGIAKQTKKYGFWTGRKILFIWETMLIIGLLGLLLSLTNALAAVSGFADNKKLLKEDPTSNPSLTHYEELLKEKFDGFFFGASSSCKASLYMWFWDWVNNNCPATLGQINCQGCHDYSIRLCEADYNTCTASGSDETTCPYEVCREGILDYFIWRIRPFALGLFIFLLFQMLLVVANMALFCYTPKLTIEEMVIKSGTVEVQHYENTKPRRDRGNSRDRDNQIVTY